MPFFHGPELIILLFILCVLGGIILVMVFWIWMLIDCVVSKRIRETQKTSWLLLIVFTHILGATLYFFLGRYPKAPAYQPMPPQAQPLQSAYQQGYQQGPRPVVPPYVGNSMHTMPPPYMAQDPQQFQQPSSDYEQPQAMYPHEHDQSLSGR